MSIARSHRSECIFITLLFKVAFYISASDQYFTSLTCHCSGVNCELGRENDGALVSILFKCSLSCTSRQQGMLGEDNSLQITEGCVLQLVCGTALYSYGVQAYPTPSLRMMVSIPHRKVVRFTTEAN